MGNRADGLNILDEGLGPVGLGRDVHHFDATAAAFKQAAELVFVGVADIVAVLGALFGHGDVGAFHVDAMDIGAGHFVFLSGNIGKNPLEFFKGQGHGRRQKEVIPRSTRHLDMASSASGVASPVSCPAQPWICISIRPGMTVKPVRSSSSDADGVSSTARIRDPSTVILALTGSKTSL